MNETKQVRLAGSVLGKYRHVCAFFHSKGKEYRVLLLFSKEGFEHGNRVRQLLTEAMSVDEVDLSEYPDIYTDESQARRMSWSRCPERLRQCSVPLNSWPF
jgi:hypothetical protein